MTPGSSAKDDLVVLLLPLGLVLVPLPLDLWWLHAGLSLLALACHGQGSWFLVMKKDEAGG